MVEYANLLNRSGQEWYVLQQHVHSQSTATRAEMYCTMSTHVRLETEPQCVDSHHGNQAGSARSLSNACQQCMCRLVFMALYPLNEAKA